ncbi:MAG: CoA-binding protein [Candidatus Wallbacteria bacterium]|nr:CoA-binding protein [Candidatus Wallbacteria bacterium]
MNQEKKCGSESCAVAVLGASRKTERYSYMALMLLREKGYPVYPVHPVFAEIEGIPVYSNLSDVPVILDTITIYLSPANSASLGTEIIKAKPRRVIFNPGAENPELSAELKQLGIDTLNACTLVLLKTGQF